MRLPPCVGCALLAGLVGCYHPNEFAPCALSCDFNAQEICPGGDPCGSDNRCHAGVAVCSPDASTAGEAAMRGDAQLVDGPRADSDTGSNCIGSDFRYCFDAPLISNVALAAPYDAGECAAPGALMPQTGFEPDVCVIVAGTITIESATVTQGSASHPLILVAYDTIDVVTLLDASSNSTGKSGAGANDVTCASQIERTVLGVGGGGAGGSFIGQGGAGGASSSGDPGELGAAPVRAPTSVRGGCPGGLGGNETFAAAPGGGAVYLLARVSITVTGTIVAGGAGGSISNVNEGGGGGASGGMIGLDAPLVMLSGASLLANGGGGAGGATSPTNMGIGQAGGNATTSFAAPGGQSGNGDTEGHGGSGSFSSAPGSGTAGTKMDGGGGGGGGSGFIVIHGTRNGMANLIEPPAS